MSEEDEIAAAAAVATDAQLWEKFLNEMESFVNDNWAEFRREFYPMLSPSRAHADPVPEPALELAPTPVLPAPAPVPSHQLANSNAWSPPVIGHGFSPMSSSDDPVKVEPTDENTPIQQTWPPVQGTHPRANGPLWPINAHHPETQEINRLMAQKLVVLVDNELTRCQADRSRTSSSHQSSPTATSIKRARLVTDNTSDNRPQQSMALVQHPGHAHPHYQAKLRWLQRRLALSFEHVDLVFQHQHLRSSPNMPTVRVDAAHRALPWFREMHILHGARRQVANIVHEKEDQEGMAELVGHTETCFDAATLYDLLWKCFVLMTRMHSIPMLDMTGNIYDSSELSVTNDVVHGTTQFEINSSTSNKVKVRRHGAVKKFPDTLVWEGVGQMYMAPTPSSKTTSTSGKKKSKHFKKIEFTRTVWMRVEPLADGRSVLHHVHRIRPIVPPSTTNSPSANRATSSLELLQRQNELQALAETLERGHDDISKLFHWFIVKYLADKTTLGAFDKGWPINGCW